MKAINILKSKRGIAIENAILFLLVVFSLCSLLTMIALIANYQFKIDKIVLEQDVYLDQIGEQFIASVPSGSPSVSDPKYVTNIDQREENGSTVFILTVFAADPDDIPAVDESNVQLYPILLYVKADTNGNILSWRYSAPTPETDPSNS